METLTVTSFPAVLAPFQGQQHPLLWHIPPDDFIRRVILSAGWFYPPDGFIRRVQKLL
jgi:hypothetical protein